MTEHDRAAEARGLMAALAAGDRGALARLIALHGRGIETYVRHQLRNPADAEDVAQEVFLRLWSTAARYDPQKGAVSTWLYRIAANLCTDRNRRRGWRVFLGLDAVAETAWPADEAPDPGRALDARRRLGRLRSAMDALPDRQRQAILMKIAGGLDTAAIAEALGVTAGAAEQLLVRARSGLRRAMGDDDDDRF